jgi:hypothetical protein
VGGGDGWVGMGWDGMGWDDALEGKWTRDAWMRGHVRVWVLARTCVCAHTSS